MTWILSLILNLFGYFHILKWNQLPIWNFCNVMESFAHFECFVIFIVTVMASMVFKCVQLDGFAIITTVVHVHVCSILFLFSKVLCSVDINLYFTYVWIYI